MSEPDAPLVVRTALVSDAPSIAAIGRVAFPALHDDIVGAAFTAAVVEPELHRIYVDPSRKRGGVGSALMRELHARLSPAGQYILLVAEANRDAQAFHERHGLVIERRVDGPSYYSSAMAIVADEPPPQAVAVIMRYTAGA